MKTTIQFLALLILSALALGSQSIQAQCPTGLAPMSISLTTDANNMETSLDIRDLTTGSTIFSIPAGSQAANTTQTYIACVDNAHCFKADLLDAAGNGGASFSITFQSQTYLSASSYGYLSTALMGNTACTDISPVLDSSSYFIKAACPIKIGDKNRIGGSVLANPNGGDICMGEKNMVSGWVKGDKIHLENNNNFGGYNGIDLFGKDWSVGICNPSGAIPAGNLHITPGPMANTTDDCEEEEVIPSNNDIHLAGPGSMLTIFPGNYGKITLEADAALFLNEGTYTMEEIVVNHAKLIPAPGGVLCEILISTDKVSFTNGALVKATINCKHVDIDDDNKFEGYIQANDPGGSVEIGNFNSLQQPQCVPCEEENNGGGNNGGGNKERDHGSLDLQPGFKTWPNPSDTGEIRFSYTESGQLDIFDLRGNKVESVYLDHAGMGREASLTLDVRHLNPGMYIGKMTQATGEVQRRTFVLL